MREVRLRFSKTGRLKYISHLDINRAMSRALKRAQIPLWYTEGFNPHPYMSFSLPLSLGVESLCESVDLRIIGDITNDEIKYRLNNVLPQDIKIVDVYDDFRDNSEIVYSDYVYKFEFKDNEAAFEKIKNVLADAEIIALAKSIFDTLGVRDLSLEINSIGCPKCRAEYHKALKEYFASRKDELCDTCKGRLDRNPMRILDCKSPICHEIAQGAPVVIDYLCDECKEHFEKVQKYLDAQNIEYKINPQIVRGLDYYTKTVFEFVSNSIGAQGTVCGGGRYDGLVEELGGQHTASLGFAMGLERLMLLMEAQGCEFPQAEKPDLFIVALGEKATLKALEIAKDMREEGFSALLDLNQRSVRAQMKYADKLGAKFNVVIGDNEVENKIAKLKNMQTGEETEINLDTFVSGFYNISLNDQLADLEINGEEFDFGSLFGLKNSEEE